MSIRGKDSLCDPVRSGSPAQRARAGFTLLEVMLAVFMIALLTFSLFRFVSVNIDALAFSTQASAEEKTITGFVNLIQGQLNELPPKGQGMLLGQAHKFKGLASDEIQWRSRGGIGLLTTAADDEYRVTLRLQPITKTSPVLDLVMKRRLITGKEDDLELRLIPDVAALEFRYFDPRLNAWLERWTDQNARPSLVRVRIWRNADDAPYEAVLTVPSAMLQQG